MSGLENSPSKLRGTCCEQRVAIAAPAETVWNVLADFARWPEWNPLYVETSGALAPGQTITVMVALAGMKPQRADATVTTVEPPSLIEYTTLAMGGMLRACRYIEITSTGPASCRVANGEIIGGPLGKLMARFIARKLREGLKGMNEGLRARAQAATASH